jgi:hypothetical protein
MSRFQRLGLWFPVCATAACVSPQPPVPAPEAHPAPPSYAESVARIATRQREDDSTAVANGRSILMTHGAPAARVYVLLHGFTDAPTQFATVGAHLFADGANVYIP